MPSLLDIGQGAGQALSSKLWKDNLDRAKFAMPTGAVGETYSRTLGSIAANAQVSGRLSMFGVPLLRGDVVAHATFRSGTAWTPGTGTPHQWSALFDQNRNQLAISADGTNSAWGATSEHTYDYTTPYTVTASGFFYIGLMLAIGTGGAVPQLAVSLINTNSIAAVPPIMAGTADTGLSNPASCPATAAALTVSTNLAYVYLT